MRLKLWKGGLKQTSRVLEWNMGYVIQRFICVNYKQIINCSTDINFNKSHSWKQTVNSITLTLASWQQTCE